MPSRGRAVRGGLLFATALAGAAGLGLEAILISSAGLAFGHGRAAALGISLYVAGWAAGALVFGRSTARLRPLFLSCGLLAAAASLLAPRLLFDPRLQAAPDALAIPVGALGILACALPQGGFLPLLVRVREARLGPTPGLAGLWSASLAGGVGGAFLLADRLVGAVGRPRAAAAAGALALGAAVLGAALAGRDAAPAPPSSPPAPAGPRLSGASAGWIVGLATAWGIGLQWIGLRLGVLWLGGMADALHRILAASLIALALGAAVLPALLPRGPRGVALLLVLAAAASAWPLVGGPLLAAVGPPGGLALALLLVGPTLVPLGAVVPVVERSTEPGEGAGRRLGGLLAHEVWGALLGGPLVHWVLVGALGLGGASAALSGCALLALPACGKGVRALIPLAGLPVLATLALAARLPAPALSSPPLANPAFEILAFEEDRDFAVTVVEDGLLGERTLLTDGFRAAGTGRQYRYMEALGHLPLLLHPGPRSVCVLALGTGTTLGAVSLHPAVERIDVLEISPAVVRQARWFEDKNHRALADDPRVEVLLGDGRRTLASRPGEYDVITLEPLLADSPFGVYLYTRDFYAVARRALAPGGLLCQWVPPHALEPATFDAVVDAFVRSFPRSSLWLFETQLILIGGDAEAAPVPAPVGGGEGTDLGRALADLGIDAGAALWARRVGDGADWPPVERPLTDVDPWVIRRPRRRGAGLLADLPRNLARIARVECEPPAAGPGEAAVIGRWRGLRALARAREAWAWEEARLRGVAIPGGAAPDLAGELASARRLLGQQPEVRRLEDEIAFLAALRGGVAALGAGADRRALERLTEAAERRPERGDVHLYLAVALERASMERAAGLAWATARRCCPRILETPAGRRAHALGWVPPGGAGP